MRKIIGQKPEPCLASASIASFTPFASSRLARSVIVADRERTATFDSCAGSCDTEQGCHHSKWY